MRPVRLMTADKTGWSGLCSAILGGSEGCQGAAQERVAVPDGLFVRCAIHSVDMAPGM